MVFPNSINWPINFYLVIGNDDSMTLAIGLIWFKMCKIFGCMLKLNLRNFGRPRFLQYDCTQFWLSNCYAFILLISINLPIFGLVFGNDACMKLSNDLIWLKNVLDFQMLAQTWRILGDLPGPKIKDVDFCRWLSVETSRRLGMDINFVFFLK